MILCACAGSETAHFAHVSKALFSLDVADLSSRTLCTIKQTSRGKRKNENTSFGANWLRVCDEKSTSCARGGRGGGERNFRKYDWFPVDSARRNSCAQIP